MKPTRSRQRTPTYSTKFKKICEFQQSQKSLTFQNSLKTLRWRFPRLSHLQENTAMGRTLMHLYWHMRQWNCLKIAWTAKHGYCLTDMIFRPANLTNATDRGEMTPKETLIRMFAKLDPPTTELAINLAIGQGFSDDEILAMKPRCCMEGRDRSCEGLAIMIDPIDFRVPYGTFGKPVCESCSRPF